jgi:hypothetical protein
MFFTSLFFSSSRCDEISIASTGTFIPSNKKIRDCISLAIGVPFFSIPTRLREERSSFLSMI